MRSRTSSASSASSSWTTSSAAAARTSAATTSCRCCSTRATAKRRADVRPRAAGRDHDAHRRGPRDDGELAQLVLVPPHAIAGGRDAPFTPSSTHGRRHPATTISRAIPVRRRALDETLRLYPPGWLLTRRSIARSRIGGFELPADTDVLVSPYLVHRHPRYWRDGDAFDPDRFLPEAVAARNRFAYLPFGLGPRACIGEHLALIEMHAHAIMLARRFRLALVPGQAIEIEPQVNLRTKQPVHMNVEIRLADQIRNACLPTRSTPWRRARAASTTSPAKRASARVSYARAARTRARHPASPAGRRRARGHACRDPGRRPRPVRRHVLGVRARPRRRGAARARATPTSTRPSSSASSPACPRRRSPPSARCSTACAPMPTTTASRNAMARLERRTVFLDEVADVSIRGIEHRASPDDVAFIQFSSGSTSEPKGVHPHASQPHDQHRGDRARRAKRATTTRACRGCRSRTTWGSSAST